MKKWFGRLCAIGASFAFVISPATAVSFPCISTWLYEQFQVGQSTPAGEFDSIDPVYVAYYRDRAIAYVYESQLNQDREDSLEIYDIADSIYTLDGEEISRDSEQSERVDAVSVPSRPAENDDRRVALLSNSRSGVGRPPVPSRPVSEPARRKGRGDSDGDRADRIERSGSSGRNRGTAKKVSDVKSPANRTRQSGVRVDVLDRSNRAGKEGVRHSVAAGKRPVAQPKPVAPDRHRREPVRDSGREPARPQKPPVHRNHPVKKPSPKPASPTVLPDGPEL